MNWFRNNMNYQAFVKFVDDNGWIYSRRFGDAPLRYLALNLFEEQNKIDYFKGFKYQHGAEYWC
jgi:mannosyltransferase